MSDERIYKLIKLIVTLMGMLPRKTLKFFSDLLGLLWYKLDKRHRNVALENINFAYPGKFSPAQAQRFVKKNFKNTASILFEVIWAYQKPRDELFKYFKVKGLKYLKKAQKKGRGVIILTCHMGNFELLVAAFPKAGMEKPYGIYRKFDFKPLERLMLEMRQRFGATLIPTGGASQKIDLILKEGGIVGTLFDQNAGWYNGVVVNFFGRPACAKYSLVKLVLRSKASVVPMFMIKENEKYIMEILPEVPLQTTGCPIKDIENNTQNYVSAIESMVRLCPEQYFWAHNRWKTKPYSIIKGKVSG
ncbi:MAG: lysophospholipid acyltransferase family protein [Desulfobacula sp.]|uniref:lysophospholipid acyltransferase family protein n=1 Tax=Desulfobacula sp. TaxID=2593537 RepID=UPI0025C04C7D|nr:lysophospholipid acyltransferase family protein [Desulfobacula sp.]MCD4721704.1 lysophospholipid acyltransferase family protein [Desulfobacula sp.]